MRTSRLFTLPALTLAAAIPAWGAAQTITSIATIPDNVFDNRLSAVGSDSGVYFRLNLSGGGNDNPDADFGYRVEFYNDQGQLVRRRISSVIDGTPTTLYRWDGQGDGNINDTLPYGAYKLRAYASVLDPDNVTEIKGSGVVIDRPGDLFVETGAATTILTWSNTGASPSIVRVNVDDPVANAPTFNEPRIDLPIEFSGITIPTNSDNGAWGVAVNSKGEIFISIDRGGGGGGAISYSIAKWATSTDTWISRTWFTTASVNDWQGLSIDDKDSLYIACSNGGGAPDQGVYRMRDNGATGTAVDLLDDDLDRWDVGAARDGTVVYSINDANVVIAKHNQNLTVNTADWTATARNDPRGIWVGRDSTVYVTEYALDNFSRININGVTRYTVTDQRLDGATGICVWAKTSTNETFIFVASQRKNQISIWQESAAGDTATFVRLIEDDVKNLSTPWDIGITPDSAIYVAAQGNSAVKKFDKNGNFVAFTNAPNGTPFIQGLDGTALLTDTQGFRRIRAMDVDETGNIYVVDQYESNNEADGERSTVLKSFNADGSARVIPGKLPRDLDDYDANVNNFNVDVNMAIWAYNSLYVVSGEDQVRVWRLSSEGDSIGGLGTVFNSTSGNDVYSIKAGPWFDRTNNIFYPRAIYLFRVDEAFEIWNETLTVNLKAAATFDYGPYPNNGATQTWPFLVDEHGMVYGLDSTEDLDVFISSSPEFASMDINDVQKDYTGFGSGAPPPVTDFNDATEMVWADGRGVFQLTGGRYEAPVWVLDKNNSRLVNFTLAWNSVVDTDISIVRANDTPIVVSSTISGNTVVLIGGTYYVGVDTITIQLNFSNSMDAANTPTVAVMPNGGSFTNAGQTSYGATTWAGTFVVTGAMNDGEAVIKAENARDLVGPAFFTDPNPFRTDSFDTDSFKPFVMDKTPPSGSVVPSDTVTTTDPTKLVTGTINEDLPNPPNFRDAQIVYSIYTTQTGGSLFFVDTNTASSADGSFSASMTLQGPAPTDNWLEVTAIDKVGNRAKLLPQRVNIRREKAVGNAFITPATTHTVGSLDRYVVKYTSGQVLSGDTLRFTIPSGWSTPNEAAGGATNGFSTITTTGSYGDSVINGGARTVTCTGVSIPNSGTFSLAYGDSVLNDNGRGGPDNNQPLDDPSNTFKVELMLTGETTWTSVPAPSGKTLTVPLTDSAASVAVQETGPRGVASAQIAKGSETWVQTTRFYNTNQGTHTDKITQVVLSVESNTGGVVAWNHVASKVVVKNTNEAITFATITSFPASQSLTISPASFTVGQGAFRDMEFWVTFASSAQADTVRFFLSGPSAATAIDSASSKTISVVDQETGVTGKKTGNFDIIGLAPAETCAIGFTDPQAGDVSTGQLGITAMRLIFRNDPSHPDTPVNQARVDRVVLQMRRADGATTLNGNALLSQVKLIDAQFGTQYGGVVPGASETMTMDLTNLTLTSGESRTVLVLVDIVENTSTVSSFRLRLSDTPLVIAKDKVTGAAMTVIDPTNLSGGPLPATPFLIDTVTIIPKAQAALTGIRLLRADSTVIQGELGDQILVGDIFYAELTIQAALGRSAVRMIPNDTDLVVRLDGVDRTSEFTITKPVAATVNPGVSTPFIYTLVQNLGSTTGTFSLDNDTTSADTRPRAFDDNDPDLLRAIWSDTPVETATVTSAPQSAAVLTIDTSYANPTETSVEIMRFRITNNRTSSRLVDKVTVEGISAGAAVLLARLYHDNDNSVLDPGTDTLVATGGLNANDTTKFVLSPKVSLGANGGSETFFIAFDFDTTPTDGDTFDARIPVNGIEILTENPFPTTTLNSAGLGVVEVAASRVTATPETQIVAVSAQTTVTLRAVDRYGNIDAVANAETSTQGNNVQVNCTFRANDSFTDTTHRIVGTSGLTNVVFSNETTNVNAKLSGGQGVLNLTDTEASPVDTLTVTSSLGNTTARVQFATLITASVLSLSGSDSAGPDSRAFLVLAFRVTNSSGMLDTVTRVRLADLSTSDTEPKFVILFRDLNGNGRIDSGTDRTIATGAFASGVVQWSPLSDTIANNDSGLYLVGFDMDTRLTDHNLVDARVDTVTVQMGGELVGAAGLNSTPDRKIDIRATHLSMDPNAGTTDAGLSLTVTVTAEDAYGNLDVGYSGGTGITWDLGGSATFQSTTLANEDIDPPPNPPFDNSLVLGNLVNGKADLTFKDNTAETVALTVTAAPGLGGTHETGQFVFRAIVNPPGSAFISPATTHQVTSLDSFTITYTAAANLSGDTLRFTIPASWAAPQKTSTVTNGYFLVTGTHTDSSISGQAVTLLGVTLANGSSLFFHYGDTTADPNGAAGPLADDPLDDPSNTFKVEVYFGTDTGFRNVPVAAAKTLTVPVRDSDVTISVVDTGAEGGVQIAKGTETTVLQVVFKNSNLGNHTDKINQIRLNVESNTGTAVAASDAISRIVVKNASEGITFADIASIPASSNVPISLSNFTVGQGASRRMEILVTIAVSASADTVRFFLSAPPGGVTAVDSASAKSITAFEVETGVANIKTGNYDIIGLAPADTLGLGFTDPLAGEVATGQAGISAMRLIFHNRPPGADTPVNSARIDQVLLQVKRADGTTGLVPNSVLSAARLIIQGPEVQVGNTTASGSGETLTFSVAGLTLNSGESKTIRVEVDIAANTTSVSQFRLRLYDTISVTAVDQVTGAAMDETDPVDLPGTLPFLIDTITIVPVAEARIEKTTLLRTDSSVINGPAGDLLVLGNAFYAALRIRATAGRSAVRMIPTNSDLVLIIDGVDKTSEFTITPPADKTIAAGNADTFFYQIIQNLGTTTGILSVANDTAGGDSQPRAYDAHDFTAPELRALWIDGTPETCQITNAPIQASVFTLDTSFASPGETAVAILKFQIKNNGGSVRYLDSVALDGLSAGAAVVLARLYHDNDNGTLNPGTDTLVASGALSAGDTILFTLSPQVGLTGSGGSETFFVAFDFSTVQTDGDTFDARIPALGVRVVSETAVPSASNLNSTGEGRVEVVARRITATPETQVVAVSAQTTVTLKAVDDYGNVDAVANAETSTQSNNVQVNCTWRANDSFSDTTHRIVTTTGMTNVVFSNETTNVNAKFSSGQGVLTLTDTEASPVDTLTVTSTIGNTTARVQFAVLITAAGVNLTGTDSAAADSRGFLVMKFRVTNSSGQQDTVTRVGIRSLSTTETEVTSVILFRDLNGNGTIDSGTDRTVATGTFATGFADFTGLADTIADGDSGLYLVGFDVAAAVTDRNLVDAQVDTVTVELGGTLVGTALQSTPNRRIDVRAVKISHSPTSGNSATGANLTVTVKSVDGFGNTDLDYTGDIGGGQKVEWNLTGNGQFLAASTLLNEAIGPANVIKGNLANGTADLVFTDGTAETIFLSVGSSPGLGGTNDTGTFVFEQGFVASDSGLASALNAPSDANRVILAFRITASGVSDSVTKIQITWVGTDTDDVSNVRLYWDLNGNSQFDSGSDTFYGTNPATFANETVTFTNDTLYIANGTDKLFFFVVDVAALAQGGDTLDAALRQSSITTQGAIANVPTTTRNSAGHETVVAGTTGVSAVALGGGDVIPGAANVEIGRFAVTVPLGAGLKVLTQVKLRNAGTHPDTGLYQVRLYSDANANNTFDAATDTLFAAAGGFVNNFVTFTGQDTFADGATRRLFIVANLSDSLAVDTKTLLARLDVSSCTFASGEKRPQATQTPTNPSRVSVALGVGAGDSIQVRGGEAVADNVDTILVSVSVIDSAGVPATGRTVVLALLDAGPTFVGPSSRITSDSGVVLFYLRHGTAGVYRCSATVNGATKASIGYLSYRDPFGFPAAASDNETRAAVVDGGVGAGVWTGNPAFAHDPADGFFYYMRGDQAANRYYLDKVPVGGGGVTNLVSVLLNGVAVNVPDYLGNIRVANIPGGGAQEVLFTGIDDQTNWRSEIYWVATGGGAKTRLSPDDPRDTDGAGILDYTDRSWRTFDIQGDTIWAGFDGHLTSFTRAGANFNSAADSKTVRLWTTFDSVFAFGSGYPGYWVQDPEVSPDGNRIAFTLLYLPAGFSLSASPADSAEIWVLKNLSAITPGRPATNDSAYQASTCTALTHPSLVRITDRNTLRFAWKPHWSADGSILAFSADTTGGFDLQKWVADHPWSAQDAMGPSNFDVYMTYYDQAGETTPRRPAKFAFEGNSIDEIAGEFDWTGTARFAYNRAPTQKIWQDRLVPLSNEATITSSGGVLFDSGRILAFIPTGETLAAGAKIASRTPLTTPAGSDSRLVITGAAKEFFAPDGPDTHVFFSETVTVILSYSAEDFDADQRVGYDADGDGIPDRVEAALNVYYWDDPVSTWKTFTTTRDPDRNRLIFETRHFSLYAGGVYGAAAFGGNVQDAVVFPNPWRIDGVGTATAGLGPGNALYGVKIGNLPTAQVQIRIYTISGQKVLEGDIHTATGAGNTANGHLRSTGDGRVSWDLRNQTGRDVASGVYIIAISGPGGTATRKVAVIR